jgi:hypothetical protein
MLSFAVMGYAIVALPFLILFVLQGMAIANNRSTWAEVIIMDMVGAGVAWLSVFLIDKFYPGILSAPKTKPNQSRGE